MVLENQAQLIQVQFSHLLIDKTTYFLEDCKCNFKQRYMSYPYEHLQSTKKDGEKLLQMKKIEKVFN